MHGVNGPEMQEHRMQNRCSLVVLADSDMSGPGSCDVHMGLPPEYADDGDYNEHPLEDDTDTGCPGGWYRCMWWWSVSRYTRPVADGVYSPNRLLDKRDDRLLDEAVNWYEQCQSRWRAWLDKKRMEKMRRETKA